MHYEKVIAGCCFLFIFANIGLASTAFSVHQPYLVAMPGVGDTGGSLILSVRTLVSLGAMLVVDRYYRLLDARVGVTLACLLTCGGFMVYSVAGSLPVFFGGAVLLGLGYGLGGMVAMTYLANRWFATGIGSVVGFASMGSGLASIVVPLVVVRIVEASSLGTAFACEGALAAAIGVLSFALLRNRPSDLGMQPYAGKGSAKASRGRGGDERTAKATDSEGATSNQSAAKAAEAAGAASNRSAASAAKAAGAASNRSAAKAAGAVESASVANAQVAQNSKQNARTAKAAGGQALLPVPRGQRVLLMAAMVGVGVFSCCGITYLSVLATSSGFSTVFAATLVSVAGVSLTLAKFAAGELFDHLGAPRGSAIMFTFALVGFVLCCFAGAGSAAVMLAGAVAMGAGLSLGTVGISVWSLDLSEPASRARQIKNFQVAYALGGFIANTLPGIVKDLVGTYVVSYAAMVVVVAAVAFIVLRFYRKFVA